MAAPALRIPMSANVSQFERDMEKARSVTGTAVRAIAQQFVNMNKEVAAAGAVGAAGAGAFAAGWGATALRYARIAAGIVITAKLIQSVVGSARAQIAEMVEIADKASKAGVSPEFWQAFIAGGKGAKEVVEGLETALTRALEATKPQINTEVGILRPEGLKEKWSDVAQIIERVQILLQGQSEGPGIFLLAKDQDQKIRGTLVAMRDLLAAGEKIEALNLGEKMFGSDFAGRVRQNSQVVNDLLRTIDEKLAGRGAGPVIFSNDNVRNAKELDDRLKDAWHTIDQNLTPSFRTLGTIALGIKEVWVNIVELMAKASGLLPQFNFPRTPQGVPINAPGSMFGLPGMESPTETPQAPSAPAAAPNFRLPPISLEDIKRTVGRATVPEATGFKGDAFTRAIEQAGKSIAMMEAETKTVGLLSEARERAMLVARLEEAAIIANTHAGLENTEVTDKQREKITELANKIEAAARANRLMEASWRTLNETLNFAGNQLVNVLDAIGDKTKSWGDTMRGVFASVKKAMLEAIVFGGGPLAGLFGTKNPVAGGTGGLLGALFGGFRAEGGSVSSGRSYWVGERGPELFQPKVSGNIVPNTVMRGAGSGGITVVVNTYPTFNSGMTPTDMAVINSQLERNKSDTVNLTIDAIRRGQSNDSSFINRGG